MVLKQLHQMGYLGHLTARDERSALNLGTEFKSCIYSLEYRVHSIEMLGGFTVQYQDIVHTLFSGHRSRRDPPASGLTLP